MADSQVGSSTTPQARQSLPAPGQFPGQSLGQFQDQLSEEYTIDTPENVSFGYEVAGIGSRFIAALIDAIILFILLIALNVAVIVAVTAIAGDPSVMDEGFESVDENWIAGLIIALYALLNFAVWWGYYMIFEWVWHGQTIGKRAVSIRVVRMDGAPLGFVPVAVRNLVRIVDFLPFAYGVGIVTMFLNRQSRRLGDYAGGTLVVKGRGELTLDALMSQIPKSTPAPLRTELPAESAATTPELTPDQDWSGIRRLTPADYELVQETIARYSRGDMDKVLLRRVTRAIATKLERLPSSQLENGDQTNLGEQATPGEQVDFLKAVAAAYGRWVK